MRPSTLSQAPDVNTAATVARFGRLDCAHNNAGITQPPTALQDVTLGLFSNDQLDFWRASAGLTLRF